LVWVERFKGLEVERLRGCSVEAVIKEGFIFSSGL
jgi:hypothetical protein